MTGTPRRLRKRDVEALLARYDDDPVAALTDALRTLLDQPADTFDGMVGTLREAGNVSPDRARALLDRHVDALDQLARDLNETRVLPS